MQGRWLGVLAGTLLTVVAAHPVGAALRSFYFDMGTTDSPLKPGYTRVTAKMVYGKDRGFGWDRPAREAFDDRIDVPEEFRATHPDFARPVDDPVLRDGIEDKRRLSFRVDVPAGRYWVSVVVGRYKRKCHDMRITLNGKVVAENVDAWGDVWGSQGGTPTKSLAVVAEPKDGQFHFVFDYAKPTPDRWKEYAAKRPENGRLWYLGPNRNAVVAIRIRPHVALPIRLEGGRLTGDVDRAGLKTAVEAFNAGRLGDAITDTLRFKPQKPGGFAAKGCVLDWITGSMRLEDRASEIALMEQSVAAWQGVLDAVEGKARASDPMAILATARIESARRYRRALVYINMYGYAWAKEETGLNLYHRYWAAYDLCGPFTPDDPLYYKSHLVRGRVAYWNGREGGWKHCYDLAQAHFAVLKKAFPNNRLARMYSGARVPSRKQVAMDAPGAPEWARLQHEALARYMDVIHYWVEHRQAGNGEFGGGWGDDVEILRTWAPAVLAVDDPVARRGLRGISEGVWNSGEIENGYSRGVGDVEHAAEPVSDTQPLMMAVDYGNPLYVERCMATMACMRDVWTAVNDHGHRHFKSHYFSATKVSTSGTHAADVALNSRAAKPGIWVLWYNRHPVVEAMLSQWCKAWIEDAFRTDNGKPPGFVPGSVRFEDDRIGGFADAWWQTRGYSSDFESVGYTEELYNHMLALFAMTNEPFYMSSLHATTEAMRAERAKPTLNPPAGSKAWAAQLSDHPDVVAVLEKWRLLTGDRRYDDYLRARGSPYMRYLLSDDIEPLVASLKKIITALSTNIEMCTSEVLFTDRVALPGSGVLFRMMTGGVGNPTGYPLHAVTWEQTYNNVAALVERNTRQRLSLQAYRFDADARSVVMRPWRLEPGTYKLSLTALEPIDRSRGVRRKRRTLRITERGQRIDVPLIARQLVRIDLRRTQPSPTVITSRPDLALGPDAVEIIDPPARAGRKTRLRVTVHNLGLVAATSARGEVYDEGRRIASFPFPVVEAPLDLKPRTAVVEVDWTPSAAGKRTLRLVVDPGNEILERVELNNSRSVTCNVDAR